MKHIYDGLDMDICTTLRQQLDAAWVQSANIIQKSSLSLSDTEKLLQTRTTTPDKPEQEQKNALNYYQAIALIYATLEVPCTDLLLYELHRIIMPQPFISGPGNPIGAWKAEEHSTCLYDGNNGHYMILNYPTPREIPDLMRRWIEEINKTPIPADRRQAVACYTKFHTLFVAIQPFFDGNELMACLVANIPVLKAGMAPIYIHDRFKYRRDLGMTIYPMNRLINFADTYTYFEKFIKSSWIPAYKLVKAANDLQKQRMIQKAKLLEKQLTRQEKKTTLPDHKRDTSF